LGKFKLNVQNNVMRTIIITICCIGWLLTAFGQTNPGPKPKTMTAAEKNLAAVHLINQAFRTGDTSKINSVVASDFVDHTDRGDLGRDSLKKLIIEMYAAFKDMKSEVIKEFADKDWVFSLMRYSGVSNGQDGMPNGPYEMTPLEVVRFKNGKIVEHWSYMEMREITKFTPQMK
jgi:predicted SnoaL-like aldol condensation-catalyzing enzyme